MGKGMRTPGHGFSEATNLKRKERKQQYQSTGGGEQKKEAEGGQKEVWTTNFPRSPGTARS